MKGYESDKLCAECGGNCCKSMGCSLSPEDMLRELKTEPTFEAVEQWLKEGEYAVDSASFMGKRLYYVRMRHKCFTFIGVDAMGECIDLTERGCGRSYENRPKGGRFLEGKENRQCEQHYTQEMMYDEWLPYQEILAGIWQKWYKVMEQDGTFDRCEEAYMEYQIAKRQKVSDS